MEPSELHRLEYDITGLTPKAQPESSLCVSHENERDAAAIAYSVKVIDALSRKMRGFNSSSETSKVSLAQIKEVFHRGAQENKEINDYNAAVWGMARVNLVLALKSGDNFLELFESTVQAMENFEGELDFTQDWLPSNKCFEKAVKDVEKYDLQDFCFGNVNELYLENYTRMEIDIL
jgi:hypothetical protein